MLVQDVMSTGVVTVQKTDTIRSAVMKMMHRHCGSLPVVEAGNQLIGVVTLRDVLIQLYPNYGDYIHDNVHSRSFIEMEDGYHEVLGGKVEDIMSKNPNDSGTPRSYFGSRLVYGPQKLPAHARRRQGYARRHSQYQRHQPRVVHRERDAALSEDALNRPSRGRDYVLQDSKLSLYPLSDSFLKLASQPHAE